MLSWAHVGLDGSFVALLVGGCGAQAALLIESLPNKCNLCTTPKIFHFGRTAYSRSSCHRRCPAESADLFEIGATDRS